MLQRRA